jgi:hypothetical protein
VLLAMSALFLARWWQSLQPGEGSFGKEFQSIRLGLVLGAAAAIILVASQLTKIVLLDDLGRLFLGALMVVGLAAAHRMVAAGRLGAGWLWAIYVTLVLVAPAMVAILAAWGFVDNWARSRTNTAQPA